MSDRPPSYYLSDVWKTRPLSNGNGGQISESFAREDLLRMETYWHDGHYTKPKIVEILRHHSRLTDFTLTQLNLIASEYNWPSRKYIRGKVVNEQRKIVKRKQRLQSASSTATRRRCEVNVLHVYWDELDNPLPCPHCLSTSQ